MAAVLVIYFALLKPLERRAKADLNRSEAQRERLSLLGEVSSVATNYLAMTNLRDAVIVTSLEVGRLGNLVAKAGRYPVLEGAIQELSQAISTLESASRGGDGEKVQAARRGVATACLAVQKEVGSLLTAT
jgi:hypothetical protein